LYTKIGFYGFLVLILLILGIYFFGKRYLSREMDKYKAYIDKQTTKDIEVWREQKNLMFSFVDFLEKRVFNNPNLKTEKKDVLSEFNLYYGKLYLVMEKKIIEKINQYIHGSVSNVQRYYLYRELRKQLMGIIKQNFGDEDCPFIEGDPKVPIIYSEKEEQGVHAKDFNSLKESYPFIEPSDKEKSKYKTLPYFT